LVQFSEKFKKILHIGDSLYKRSLKLLKMRRCSLRSNFWRLSWAKTYGSERK